MYKRCLIVLAFALLTLSVQAQEPLTYQLPPQEIIDLVDAPSTPSVRISPDNKRIAFMDNPDLPAISDLAQEELRLGGMRIDPRTNGPSRASYGTGISLADIDGKNIRMVQGLPAQARIRNLRWSPNGMYLAFTNTVDKGIELWYVNVQQAQAFKLTEAIINDVMGTAFAWTPDNQSLIFSAIPEGRGEAPARPRVAEGPVAQESMGRRAAVRTFQDMLRNRYDEDIFDYYATSQIAITDLQGKRRNISKPDVYWYFSLSPNGAYLLTNRISKPYSYIVPFSRFPQTFEILNLQGELIHTLAEIPLSDNLPQGFGATRTGPRSITWRNDVPATLFWAEALDGGDPANETEFRDQVYFLEAPFNGQPKASVKTQLRYSGIIWGKHDFAIVAESWSRTRRSIVSSFNPDLVNPVKDVMIDRSTEDNYNNPGSFQMRQNAFGQSVLLFDNRNTKLYLFGQGASPEGNRPFVDEYDIRSKKTRRMWRSEAPYFEVPIELVDVSRGLVITRRESNTMHPNYFMRDMRRNRLTQITFLPDPFEKLRDLHSEMIHYTREDGIPLSGTLFLPAGYNKDKDGPLPTLLWAYPREFKSADAAGQVSGSPYTYTRVGASSPVMLATQGYAVLNNASFPIVGEADQEPNDTFVEQLVANAKAAIDKLVEMGVTDPKRVAVSGHSYGAFMTANLLAHSDLFAAGIARSGAYNRTLTPFGFQGEERTYWDAPEIYHQMSPFTYAHKVKAPILLIHGADDNNAGTFPMQSERFYDALRGHGSTVRLVMLPHESHGYNARESVLHMHWEWLQWLDRYVKNKK